MTASQGFEGSQSSVPPLPPSGADRTGPPWEGQGPIVERFVDTLRSVLTDPTGTFARMRREGGFGPPLIYALISGIASGILGMLIGFMLPFGRGWGMLGGMFAAGAGTIMYIVIGPIFLICGLFIWSGLVHVVLSLTSAAKFPFETTFRVVAYSYGSAAPIGIVPIIGGWAAAAAGIVCSIFGLAQAQETTTGKAATAVLVPVAVCCGVAGLFMAMGMAAALLGGLLGGSR